MDCYKLVIKITNIDITNGLFTTDTIIKLNIFVHAIVQKPLLRRNLI